MATENTTKKLPSKATVIRTAVLVLAIANNALAIAGKSPLPIDSDTLTEVISFIFTTAASLVNWWYNNSFTQKAIEADEKYDLG
jgi:SPP1 family holin